MSRITTCADVPLVTCKFAMDPSWCCKLPASSLQEPNLEPEVWLTQHQKLQGFELRNSLEPLAARTEYNINHSSQSMPSGTVGALQVQLSYLPQATASHRRGECTKRQAASRLLSVTRGNCGDYGCVTDISSRTLLIHFLLCCRDSGHS